MFTDMHAGSEPLGRLHSTNHCDDSAGCPLRHAGQPSASPHDSTRVLFPILLLAHRSVNDLIPPLCTRVPMLKMEEQTTGLL